jgi:hypothetical protein
MVASTVSPQRRGRQLELLVLGILQVERLAPRHRVVVPGEEVDLTFVLDGQHYLMECKWEQRPVGLPVLERFATKVRRKAEGTFGVVLSMSGYARGINEKAARGERLNCVGLTRDHLSAVLRGRTTFKETVRRARRAASDRSLFCESSA